MNRAYIVEKLLEYRLICSEEQGSEWVDGFVSAIVQAYEEEVGELEARMGMAMDGFHEVQLHCGHPMGCVNYGDGGDDVAYCEMCMLEGQVRQLWVQRIQLREWLVENQRWGQENADDYANGKLEMDTEDMGWLRGYAKACEEALKRLQTGEDNESFMAPTRETHQN